MTLDLTWLRTWVEVVDVGGFARAAEQIHLSQPRVSAHIASLERELGCCLIERRVRPLTLTEEGKLLLPKARAVLAAADDLASARLAEQGELSGSVKVASFASASAEFLPQVFTKLKAAHPLVELGVLDGDVNVIEAALSEHRVSVAIRPLRPEPRIPGLSMRPLWREPFVALVPRGHALAEQDEVRPEQLARERVITIGNPLADSLLGYEAQAALSRNSQELPFGTVSHQPTTLAAMVRGGHGVGVINYLAAVMIHREGLETRPITGLKAHRDVGIWWHAEHPLSRAARAFIDVVLDTPRPEGTSQIPVR
jgi:LysR family transcriptional regulator, hydrogen peroxide-inducible genes activator